MAACDSLRLLFEKRRPMGENPTLVDSLSSWIQINPMHRHPLEQASLTEIFGELHFKERPEPPHAEDDRVHPVPHPTSGVVTSTPAFDPVTVSFHRDPRIPEVPRTPAADEGQGKETDSHVGKIQNPIFPNPIGTDTVRSVSPDPPPTSPEKQRGPCAKTPSPSFPAKNSESLHLCTEGLGFESSDDMEDSRSESGLDWIGGDGEVEEEINSNGQRPPMVLPSPKGCSDVRSRTGTGRFPPPISVIGSSGKPWVYFKAYKGDGRFVLKEVRIPTYELLQASREDGRLKLHLMQPEDRGEGMELDSVGVAGEEDLQQQQDERGK